MTRPVPDTDRILADLFAEDAPPHEPPLLIPALLARTALTRQRPAWRVPSWWLPASLAWRPRTSGRTNTMFSVLRLAAVGVILALTSGLLFATVTLSPSPASPGPSPTPSPIAMPGGDLEAGTTYAIDTSAIGAGDHGRLLVTVPGTGWFAVGPGHFGKDVMESSDSLDGYDIRLLGPYFVSNINADPCRWRNSALEPPVGPTVDDLATALMAQPEQHASSVSDVTVGGYAGKKVELSVPDELGACDGGNYQRWYDNDDPYSYGPYTWGSSQRDTVYIIDVEGTRWVIDTHYRLGVPDSDLAELDQLVASIRFELPPVTAPIPSPGSDGPARNGRIAFMTGTTSTRSSPTAATAGSSSMGRIRWPGWHGHPMGRGWRTGRREARHALGSSRSSMPTARTPPWSPRVTPRSATCPPGRRLVTGRLEAGLHRADGRWPADGMRRIVRRLPQLLHLARLRGRGPCRRVHRSRPGRRSGHGRVDRGLVPGRQDHRLHQRRCPEGGDGLYLMDADGTNVRRIDKVFGTGGSFGKLAWSPDGTSIAAAAGVGIRDIWVFAVRRQHGDDGLRDAGGSPRPGPSHAPDGRPCRGLDRARDRTTQGNPAYAPDGALAWSGWLLEEGGTPRTMAVWAPPWSAPVWSPDGRFIARARGRRCRHHRPRGHDRGEDRGRHVRIRVSWQRLPG